VVDRPGVVRTSVTSWLDTDADRVGPKPAHVDPIAGRLVHRLFQGSHLHARATSLEDAAAMARDLLSPEERGATADVDAVTRAAAQAWQRMRDRDDVVRALEGVRYYEVPFSSRQADSTVLRGTIDCLVERADGSIGVVEFKTGRPRPSHQRQLDIYVEAARSLFPGVAVTGVLLYA
jgi:RecB family exonuclease